LPEFLYAAQNDPRTKAVVVYVEPGGYYEKQALDWIQERRFGFSKPIIACVTGRWKKDINRAVGHAGALAGSGDDALAKEEWFDSYFGVGVFDPAKPKVSKKGVRVSSIQNIPEAVQAVFEKIGEPTDFQAHGDLSLKPWLGDANFKLPPELNIPLTEAIEPYNIQIKEINKQVGAHYLRQNMSDKSGASRMDPRTQISELHGKTVLELSKYTMEENIYFALAKVMPDKRDIPTIDFLLNLFLKMDENRMNLVEVAKGNECSPNAYIASQVALIGNKSLLDKARIHSKFIINLIREFELNDETTTFSKEVDEFIREKLLTDEEQMKSEVSDMLLKEIKSNKKKCIAIDICKHIISLSEKEGKSIRDTYEFLLASIGVCIFWKPMLENRISRQVVEDAVSYFYVLSRITAYSVIDRKNNKYWQKLVNTKISNISASFTENAFKILFNRPPTESELYEFRSLLGLTITNGPGTISAKGAKESVSARNHISMAYVGFMSNTGFAHGGNGFEAVQYLLEQFAKVDLKDPGDKNHKIDLQTLAIEAARTYGSYKQLEKETGDLNYRRIPCINHPVFKGHDVNIDPRESFIRGKLEEQGIYNIFLDFYHHLVQELFNEGITKNVFCVNVDAVLAVIILKLVWKDLRDGKLTNKQVQDIVFTLFLFGRAIGVTAEIADHRDRGTDMDCRTPESKLSFVL